MTLEADNIEAEITRSRSALNDTIEALGGKLSPGQIVDEVMGLAKGQAGQFTANLGRQVRDNPLPLLLIGAGIGMMLLNNRKGGTPSEPATVSHDEWHAESKFRRLEGVRASVSQAVGETADAFSHRLHEAEAAALEMKQHAGEAIDGFKARVKAAGEQLQASAHKVRERMTQGARDAASFVKHEAGEVKHKAQDFYNDYPLAAGAIGVAIGAIIGASAPLSDVERTNLAGAADAAAKAGADLAQKGAQAVERASDKAVAALH